MTTTPRHSIHRPNDGPLPPGWLWVKREGDHRVSEDDAGQKSLGKRKWAYELTLVTMGSDEPDRDPQFPNLIIGMAPAHKPGVDVGQNAIRALNSIRAREHPAGWPAGDLA